MSANPLRPSAILQAMADALPTHDPSDSTSDLSSSHEALALFTHGAMTSVGFRLLGFDEDKPDEANCHALAPRLPANWNASFNSYSFVYAHQQSALRFVIKVDRMGSRAEIRGLASTGGDERIARCEVEIRNHVSAAALPLRITLSGDDRVEDRSDLPQKLRDVFVSDPRIEDLASMIKIFIIQCLLPSLQKEGYEEEDPDDRAARQDAEAKGGASRRPTGTTPPPLRPGADDPYLPRPAEPQPFKDPLDPAGPRRDPIPAGDFPPPDFEDPYDLNRPFRPSGAGGIGPFGGNLGADDLNPPGLGPHDPLRPSLGGPFRGGEHSGMHPTFPFGGGGDSPMGGVPDFPYGHEPPARQPPPGARYDPIGPGGGIPRGPGGFGGGRGGHFGGGGGGFGGFGGGDII